MRQTEEKLEKALRLLTDHFGPGTSIGLILATVCAKRLRREGIPVTEAAISHRSGISRQSVSRWVRKLEGQGALYREPHPADQRVSIITGTNPEASDALLAELVAILSE